MIKVNDILKTLEAAAPPHLAESYDNVGLLVGRGFSEVENLVIALDITKDVIAEAKEKKAQLIVSHHPIIFGSLSSVTNETVSGELVLSLAEAGISAICMHTNLDSANGGVNDMLAKALGMENTAPVMPKDDGISGGGRYGYLTEKKPLSDFLSNVCSALMCDGVKYHDAGRDVFKVAVGGGSCGGYVYTAHSLGCDTLVTADVKHNHFIDAAHLGINLIDAGHFATEDVVCEKLLELLKNAFPSLNISIAESDKAYTRFYTV